MNSVAIPTCRFHIVARPTTSGLLVMRPRVGWLSVWVTSLRRRGGLAFSVFLFLFLALRGSAADWPMFRGDPSLSGISTEKLTDSLSKLWGFKTGAAVKSSAAIVDGKVFIGSLDEHVYALDLKTGEKLWKFKTQGGVESSPLVLDGKVYVGSEDSWLYALNARNGELVWKFQTGDKILGGPNWVKAPKGDSKWVLAGSYDFKLYCLDATTGKSNWVFESSNYINGTPAVARGQTVFGGCDALVHVISLADGSVVKQFDAGAYIAASAALSGKFAFVGHYENEFLCFDLEKGTNVWSYKDRGFPYFSSPALTETRVIVGGRDKRLHCIDRVKGDPLWVFATRGKVDSSPVVAGDKVVVGSDDGFLYMVNLETGKERWSFEIGRPVGGSPAISEGRIVVGSDDGNVYCFGPQKGATR